MYLDVMMSQKNLTLTKLLKNGILIIEPVRLSLRRDGKFIIYQTIGIWSIRISTKLIENTFKKRYVDKKNFNKSTGRHDNMFVNRDQDHYNFLVPEISAHSILHAEALAVRHSLVFVLQKRFPYVIMKSDCKILIQSLQQHKILDRCTHAMFDNILFSCCL
ncbi:hypothetical protein Cni_G13548 [Canna indica]|uniref:RNase H type-1 domain-containing protein n=1 Tax=Canna indica TaxID=4628 RepID=A0AAQ3KFY9_9LILI|nr:hypothetical protein Cni_G13548 [Canna indica]